MLRKIFTEVKNFIEELSQNSVGAYSAQAAFFVITSFFPFMMLTVALLQFTPFSVENLYLNETGKILDTVTGDTFETILREVTLKSKSGALLGAAGVSALWAASRCMLAIIQGLDKVYSVKMKRNWLRLQLLAIRYVLALQIILIVSLGLIVFGEQISRKLMLSPVFDNARWLLIVFLLVAFFTMLYTFVPDVSEKKLLRRLTKQLPGAVITTAGWLIFSIGFAAYIKNFSDYGAIYGSLATAVIAMLWLYFCMFIMFIGGMVNAKFFPEKAETTRVRAKTKAV